jgi:hypothetical protein
MVGMTDPALRAQRVYARALSAVVLVGLGLIAVLFAAYLAGWLPTRVPAERAHEVWAAAARPALRDFPALLPIAFLAGGSCVPLAAVLVVYARTRERFYLGICALQILLLALAASGIFTLGH